MREPLMVAVAQPPCVPHDVAANARAHAAAIRSPDAAGARVVVFPELSLTGYELAAAPVDPGDDRLQPIIRACADTGATALVGAPVTDNSNNSADNSKRIDNSKYMRKGRDGRVFIAVLAVDGQGVSVAYRKMWLGDEEAERFTPGPEPRLITVGGWRLGLAVCKDTGVAQHAADTAALGIDAYLAGTVKHDHEAGLQHERARRIARQYRVWVAVASFAGATGGGYGQTAGRSGIWAPDGTLVTGAGPQPGEVSRAALRRAPLG
jgi:predicted amidohydrolase